MFLATDREKCAHLLRRFGLGASEAELDYYLQDGLNGAIDRLLDDQGDDGFNLDPDALSNDKGIIPMPLAVDWWIMRMLVTRHPLREKMTLFWHDHFATSASKVGAPLLMLAQNETLRRNATGNFRTLLKEASQDPAMILWLDNQQNVRGHANENFAREVMELFTLGIGHYSEKDIQEAARAFTGWSLRRNGRGDKLGKKTAAEYQFRPNAHDTGQKTVLGSTGPLEGEDVLNILCDQPRTAEYITWKIWDWFVWNKPDDSTIAPFVRRFRESGLDLKALLRDIMRSSEFYSNRAVRAVVKNPVDFCVTTLRQLGVGEQLARSLSDLGDSSVPRGIVGPAHASQLTMKGMGMWLMYPPDVAGWDNGQAWITSATMVERIGWADKIFGQGKTAKVQLRYPAYSLFESDPTPAGVANKLMSIFDAPIRRDKIPALVASAQKAIGDRLTPQNANAVAAQVARLIFASPEFQFC